MEDGAPMGRGKRSILNLCWPGEGEDQEFLSSPQAIVQEFLCLSTSSSVVVKGPKQAPREEVSEFASPRFSLSLLQVSSATPAWDR